MYKIYFNCFNIAHSKLKIKLFVSKKKLKLHLFFYYHDHNHLKVIVENLTLKKSIQDLKMKFFVRKIMESKCKSMRSLISVLV